jgi:hypothetical protein
VACICGLDHPAPVDHQTRRAHAADMFTVSDAEAAAIRDAFEQKGVLSAAIELRRLFPGIQDNGKAADMVRAIAGWRPATLPRGSVTRLRPRIR